MLSIAFDVPRTKPKHSERPEKCDRKKIYPKTGFLWRGPSFCRCMALLGALIVTRHMPLLAGLESCAFRLISIKASMVSVALETRGS
jgi:hypothetical protein